MLVLGDVHITSLRQLVQLPFDHPERDVAEQPDDLQRVLRERHRHRLDVEVVAQEHRDVVAPSRVHGQPAAPQVGAVDDVVMDECGRMDELDHRGVEDRAVSRVARQARRHQQYRPDGPACRRSSGCNAPFRGSAQRETGCGGRTHARRPRDPLEWARRSGLGQSRRTISGQCRSKGCRRVAVPPTILVLRRECQRAKP